MFMFVFGLFLFTQAAFLPHFLYFEADTIEPLPTVSSFREPLVFDPFPLLSPFITMMPSLPQHSISHNTA